MNKITVIALYRYGTLHISASYLVVLKPKLNTPTVFSTRRCICVDRESAVGIAICYGMGGSGVESR